MCPNDSEFHPHNHFKRSTEVVDVETQTTRGQHEGGKKRVAIQSNRRDSIRIEEHTSYKMLQTDEEGIPGSSVVVVPHLLMSSCLRRRLP